MTDTPEGAIMFETFRGIREQFEKGFEQAHNLHKNHAEVLRIGYMQGLDFSKILNNVIDKFRSDYPNAKIEIQTMNNNDLIAGIDDVTLDIVFTLERILNFRSDLDGRVLYETPISIMFSTNQVRERVLDFQDLQNKSFIVLSKNQDFTDYETLINICEKLHFEPKRIIQVSSVESQIINVEFGFGVAISNHMSRMYGNPKFSFMDIPNMTTKIVGIFKKKHATPMIDLLIKYL